MNPNNGATRWNIYLCQNFGVESFDVKWEAEGTNGFAKVGLNTVVITKKDMHRWK